MHEIRWRLVERWYDLQWKIKSRFLRDGQHGVDRTATNLGDYSVSFCLKQVPERLNMCPCGVWLRPNLSTTVRIRAGLAAAKRQKERTQPMADGSSEKKAMDARRGATKRHEDTSVMDRWQNKIVIRQEAPYRQRLQYESTLYMRGVEPNAQGVSSSTHKDALEDKTK